MSGFSSEEGDVDLNPRSECFSQSHKPSISTSLHNRIWVDAQGNRSDIG